jgi:hypothetical protein
VKNLAKSSRLAVGLIASMAIVWVGCTNQEDDLRFGEVPPAVTIDLHTSFTVSDPDETILQTHLRQLAARLSVKPETVSDGQVIWIRAHHVGGATFCRDVEPLLDTAMGMAPVHPSEPGMRLVVQLLEWAPGGHLMGTVLSREDVLNGAFARSHRRWTDQVQNRMAERLGTADGLPIPEDGTWWSEFYRWINKQRPAVQLERGSNDGCLLSGLLIVHRNRRNAAIRSGDYEAFCKEERLNVSFLLASTIQRDLDLRKQVHELLRSDPARILISVYGAYHDPGVILAGIEHRKILAVEGIEGSQLVSCFLTLRDKLTDDGFRPISLEEAVEYRGRARFMTNALQKGLTTKEANVFSERKAKEVLATYGTWTDWARTTRFQH